MPWHAERAPGASGGANEVGHAIKTAERARLRSRVGWWGACGWGVGMPAPAGQIPPPWAWRENEAPAARAACGPSQAIGLVGLTVRLLLGEPALGAPGIVLGFLQDVRDERIAKFLLRELIL